MASVQELMKRYGGDTSSDNVADASNGAETPVSTASPVSYGIEPQQNVEEDSRQQDTQVQPAPDFDFSDDEFDSAKVDVSDEDTGLDLSLDDDDDDDFDLGSYYPDTESSVDTASNSEGRPLVTALAEDAEETGDIDEADTVSSKDTLVDDTRTSRHALDEEPVHTQQFDSVDNATAPALQDEDRPTLSSLVNRDKPSVHTDAMPQPLQSRGDDTQHTTDRATVPAEVDRQQVESVVDKVLSEELPVPAKSHMLLSSFALGLFFPLGAFSVAASFDTLRHAYMGEPEKSKSASGRAVGFAIPAIVFGVVFWSVILAYIFMPDQFDRLYSKIGLG